MVQAHDETIPGDSVSYWTIERRRFALDSPRLVVEIRKPSKCVIVIKFEMERNHGIVIQLISCLSMKLSKAAETQRMSHRGFQSLCHIRVRTVQLPPTSL